VGRRELETLDQDLCLFDFDICLSTTIYFLPSHLPQQPEIESQNPKPNQNLRRHGKEWVIVYSLSCKLFLFLSLPCQTHIRSGNLKIQKVSESKHKFFSFSILILKSSNPKTPFPISTFLNSLSLSLLYYSLYR